MSCTFISTENHPTVITLKTKKLATIINKTVQEGLPMWLLRFQKLKLTSECRSENKKRDIPLSVFDV